MKLESKTYSVSLNEDEIDVIVNALHACYMDMKETPQESKEDSQKTYVRMQPLKELRNSFANLINRSFMGKDA